jgi:hypothetical protein
MLAFVADNAGELSAKYGNVTKASVRRAAAPSGREAPAQAPLPAGTSRRVSSRPRRT